MKLLAESLVRRAFLYVQSVSIVHVGDGFAHCLLVENLDK